MDSYKSAKEAFVSGLSGTSFLEVSILILLACLGYHLKHLAVLALPLLYKTKDAHALISWTLEFVTTILPCILAFTVLADRATSVLVGTLLLCVTLLLVFLFTRWPLTQESLPENLKRPYPCRVPYLSVMRTYTTLCTTVAILAVDFPAFPRRLAKTETYGTGLMDVGVGLFVHAHGVTSPEARKETAGKVTLATYARLFCRTLKSVLPLVVLGAVRLLAVKGSGYQEHVTEYGAHWNFFFTIAVVRLFSSLLQPLVTLLPSRYPYGLLSLVLLCSYQYFLSGVGGSDYVLYGPNGDGSRPTFFSANREGIISSVGYLALYLLSVEIGRWLFSKRATLGDLGMVSVQLFFLDGILWILTKLSDSSVQPVSRRFANAAFVSWVLSLSTLMSAVFAMGDFIVFLCSYKLGLSPCMLSPLYDTGRGVSTETPKSRMHCFVAAMNHNQFLVFLLANVMTGLVNLSLNTLEASTLTCVLVLCTYMACLCTTALFLYRVNFKIKL